MNASEMAKMAQALLLEIDPVAALNLPSSHAGQQTVIKGARRFNVIAAGRRWGKNTLAEGQIIQPALQGKPVAWFSPTYKTLADDWRRLQEEKRRPLSETWPTIRGGACQAGPGRRTADRP